MDFTNKLKQKWPYALATLGILYELAQWIAKGDYSLLFYFFNAFKISAIEVTAPLYCFLLTMIIPLIFVVLWDYLKTRKPRLTKLQKEILGYFQDLPENEHYVPTDISEHLGISLGEARRIFVILNNFGYIRCGPFEQESEQNGYLVTDLGLMVKTDT